MDNSILLSKQSQVKATLTRRYIHVHLRNALNYFLAGVIAFAIASTASAQRSDPPKKIYLSTEKSLSSRPAPEWFGDAKFGIFVHWGLYSVPAWATPSGTPDTVTNWNHFYTNNPYAEWYLNTLRIDGSPTQIHHRKTYGTSFDYYDFVNIFNKGVKNWKAQTWAKLFSDAGAKYVVLTSKHSEGFTLFPSSVPHPLMNKSKINSPRDLVGEVAAAVRAQQIKFGVYYSGGLDWSFVQSPITNIWPDLFENIPKSPAYAGYADMHMYELIRKYKPDVLWNDVNYPEHGDILGILAELYNANPDAVTNDRWRRYQQLKHFTTPEYVVLDSITTEKWETCRGIGYSFGYNQVEGQQQYLTSNELIDMLVDIVSKNGNLLLNVGPRADGSIPEVQASRLLDIGSWLKTNGEAIYSSRPWKKASAVANDSTQVRFTQKDSSIYMIFLERPKQSDITVPDLRFNSATKVSLLGHDAAISWQQDGNGVRLSFPANANSQHAYTFKFTPGGI
jgi:alpha-L-fucosidase